MGFIGNIESYAIKNIIQTYIFYVIKTIIMKFCIETYEIKYNLIIENKYYN